MFVTCPKCGFQNNERNRVMNARSQIMKMLRGAKQPIGAGELADAVYGEDSRRNRSRVIANVWHMNQPTKRINSNGGRTRAAKGYSIVKRSEVAA